MAGDEQNSSLYEVLDKHQFKFYKYYHVLFELGLKPNEVHTLSIILSFNKAGQDYSGSCSFLSKRLNITSRTALNTLNSLINKGFIKKQASKGGNTSVYSINDILLKDIFLNYEKNSQLTNNKEVINYEKNSQKLCKNFTVNYEKFSHNKNIYKNNIYAHSENEQESESKEDTQKEDDKSSSKCTTMKQNTKNKAIAKKELRERQEKQFGEFWQIYPRKVNKKQAIKKWQKINPDDELLKKILQSLSTTISTEWKNRDEQYIPHASTWLNNERWNDELEAKQPIAQKKEKPKIVYTPVVEDLMADYKEDDTQNTSKNSQQAHQ